MMYTVNDLQELKRFFDTAELPKEIEVTKSQKITDVRKFINSHLSVAGANIGKNAFILFYERLVKLKELLQK